MAAKRINVAVLLMCIVVLADVAVQSSNAYENIEMSDLTTAHSGYANYKACFNYCKDACKSGGMGNSFCEISCDNACEAHETASTY
ncbi:hypothetical protein BVC80_441g192 [Macleaya cordata]|uniref:Pollen allergen ole e 6 n=1 Tax=Macleaya cordata TaxID=56857 RepID=A0A200Q4N4_MACCD|nr:hypothetical protein BVC80_441g192 [Macleaya cordata]